MAGNCVDCRHLTRTELPSVGICGCPAEVAPPWQGARRLVTIKAVKGCPAWEAIVPVEPLVVTATITLRLGLEDLREQRRWLIKNHRKAEEAEGLLNMVEFIQDQIHEQGLAGEEEVWGRTSS